MQFLTWVEGFLGKDWLLIVLTLIIVGGTLGILWLTWLGLPTITQERIKERILRPLRSLKSFLSMASLYGERVVSRGFKQGLLVGVVLTLLVTTAWFVSLALFLTTLIVSFLLIALISWSQKPSEHGPHVPEPLQVPPPGSTSRPEATAPGLTNNTQGGKFSDTFFDSSFDYDQAKELGNLELAEDYIQAHQRLNENLLYAHPACAKKWLDLCDDIQYEPYQESRRLIGDRGKEFLSSLSLNKSYDFISLGPGNGEKDKILLQVVSQKMSANSLNLAWYYPIDCSYLLLVTSCHAVRTTAALRPNLRIKSIHGDFQKLERYKVVYQDNTRRRIFSLLGNTFGNFRENELMNHVIAGMTYGDYLIIEVQLLATKTYNETVKTQFLKQPLMILDPSGKCAESLKTSTRKDISEVPGSLTTHVTATWKNVPFEVTFATKYNHADLKKWLIDDKHLEVVHDLKNRRETIGVFVVQKQIPAR